MLKIYGMMMLGAMLWLTSCTSEDATQEVAPQEAIAISFGCNYDDEEENITKNTTRAGYEGAMNTEDLYTTGFGAMASVTAGTVAPYDNKPNLMYNQEVKYTHVGDMENPLTGYWSYQPVKYWPTDLTHCYISAYAPYQELPIDGSGTGIIGLSTNSEAPYVDYRRCDNPQNVVDLLWYYEKPENIPAAGKLAMKMRHALARLELKVALASDVELDAGTKVLIEKITLTGQMAKTGRLSLCSQETTGSGVDKKYYPVWSGQTYDPAHSIQIKNADNDDASYGIIDSQVRYIEGMPYSWQPAGLSTTLQNALSTGDRTGYVYLIPQPSAKPEEGGPTGLELTVEVKYHQMTSGSDKKTTTTKTTTVASPLKGNTTYTLNLTLKKIVDP